MLLRALLVGALLVSAACSDDDFTGEVPPKDLSGFVPTDLLKADLTVDDLASTDMASTDMASSDLAERDLSGTDM